jgi:hypothetical protein
MALVREKKGLGPAHAFGHVSGNEAGLVVVAQHPQPAFIIRAAHRDLAFLRIEDRQREQRIGPARPGERRIECDGLLATRDGVIGPVEFDHHAAPHVMTFGIVRISRQQMIEALQRVIVAVQREKGSAAVQQCFRHVLVQDERAVVARQGIGNASECVKDDAAVRMRRGVVRAQRNCAIEALQRLSVAVELVLRKAAIVDGFGIIRLDRNGAVKAFQRLFVPLPHHPYAAAVVVGVGKAAFMLDRLLEGRKRVVVAIQRDKHKPVVEKDLRRLWSLLHCR